jgi:uncharacterized membrane-anchored protein YhcB (DUF1043 family)
MLTAIIWFLIGVLIGAVATVFVARNNRAKVEKALNAMKFAGSDEYKNYMTKWSDEIKKPDELK